MKAYYRYCHTKGMHRFSEPRYELFVARCLQVAIVKDTSSLRKTVATVSDT